jgi:hypothetical protein
MIVDIAIDDHVFTKKLTKAFHTAVTLRYDLIEAFMFLPQFIEAQSYLTILNNDLVLFGSSKQQFTLQDFFPDGLPELVVLRCCNSAIGT